MLRQYYELYAMFNRLDTSDDRRIDKDEFKQGAEMVKSWGVTLPDDTDGEFNSIDTDGGGKILFDEVRDTQPNSTRLLTSTSPPHHHSASPQFAKWGILKALDLEEDDNFDDGGETAKHEAVGYIAERDAGKKGPLWTPEGQPTLCYPQLGALVPIQTMPRANRPPEARGPFSPYSMSRAKVSPVFQQKIHGAPPVLGGVPYRQLVPKGNFLRTSGIKDQARSGLPYALGQLLMEKAKEDKEAYESMLKDKTMTFEDRSYGVETLDVPKSPTKKEGAGGSPKKLENKAGGGAAGGNTAKVAPA